MIILIWAELIGRRVDTRIQAAIARYTRPGRHHDAPGRPTGYALVQRETQERARRKAERERTHWNGETLLLPAI